MSKSKPHAIFVSGYPGDVGGANTELWHTVKLWRRQGHHVTLLPTWKADPRWHARLEAIGCRTLSADPNALHMVEGLAHGVVVSFCNTRFLAVADRFRKLGCRIVWVGCMNWIFPKERLHYVKQGPFDRYVFQSRYQRDQLVPQLCKFGYEEHQGRVLRGAFDVGEFPFAPRPHVPESRLTIGRISRAAADKFATDTWKIYRRIPHSIEARVLGWSDEVAEAVGTPPSWAECLPAGQVEPRALLATLHAMVHTGGWAVENWPRVGLEAMAAGVPIVVENRGGWREMIRHGETGYLCDTEEQYAYYTARLAYDEPHRLQIARQARETLVATLAAPEAIATGWDELFASLHR